MAKAYEAPDRRREGTTAHLWPEEPLFQRGRWWWVASAIAIGVLLGLGSLEVISLVARALAVVFLGATLAAALFPIVSWLERYLPRIAAVVIVYVAIAAIFAGLGWLVLPRLWTEAREVGAELPGLIRQSRGWLDGILGQQATTLDGSLSSLADNVTTALAGVPNAVVSLGAALVVALFISFYWLILHKSIRESFLSLFPGPRRQSVHDVLAQGADSMGGYLRGVMIDSVIVAAMTYAGLLLIGVDYALVLAVVMGLFEIVPVVGAAIGFLVVSAIAFLQGTTTGLYTAGFMLALQQIENHVLAPNIMGSQTDASPLLVLIAVFAGGAVGGFMGALVAIPLAAFLQVIFVKVIAPAFRQHAGAPPVEEKEEEKGSAE